MHFSRVFFLLLLWGLAGCADDTPRTDTGADSAEASASAETSGPAEASTDWTPLLADGTLDDWEMYSQEELEGWTLTDGELHASGAGWDAGEDLVTKEDYGDFELALEWKIESGNSSGIFYHVPKDGTHEIYELAPEYQVMDDEGWDTELEPNQRTAGNYAMYEPIEAATQPVGEWNTTRIVVRQPHVEHWLNGKKVVEYEVGSADWQARKAGGKWAEVDDYATASSGRIGLQNAGKVTYRDIKIRKL